jgi:hypothetical protein
VENIVYYACVAFGVLMKRMMKLLSLPLKVFAKSATCPSAEALLGFSKSPQASGRTEPIASHLNECDFCRAELQLLKRFPCKAEPIATAEMPPSLRVLAESILGQSHRTSPARPFQSPHVMNH